MNGRDAVLCHRCATALAWPHHGRPTLRAKQWEYDDLLVPLRLRTQGLRGADVEHHFRRAVEGALLRAKHDGGWRPCGPTDWDALRRAGRIDERRVPAPNGFPFSEYLSVRICVRRFAVERVRAA